MTDTRTRRLRQAALCVTHADGWFEIFGENTLDVHVATMPETGTLEGEIIAEDYLGTTLPARFRKIYYSGMLRASGMIQRVTPQDIAHRQLNLALLRTVDTLNGREEVLTWTM